MPASVWVRYAGTGVLFVLAVVGARAVVVTSAAASTSSSPEPRQSGISFQRIHGIPPVTDRASTGGVSWIDYDGDGHVDLFVANGYDVSAARAVPEANRLYRNLGGGRFQEVDVGPLTADRGFSSGSAWADVNNDGRPDVFVANQRGQPNFLYRSDGDGRFARIEAGPAVLDSAGSFSASWADVDGDGLVDLVVANGGLSQAAANFLYRNRGEFRLERVDVDGLTTEAAGSGAVAWADFDSDGRPDLFVANRWAGGDTAGPGMSRLYRNLGGWRFAAVPAPPAADTVNAISAAWGDYDGDGLPDLYVTSLSTANRLYRNDGRGGFERVPSGPPVLDGGQSTAAAWCDLDNDGHLDLVVGNWGSAVAVYENAGGGGFRRLDAAGDLGRTISHPSSLACADYDGDGALDLYVGNWPNWPGQHEENELYRNTGAAGHWLAVGLEGTRSNRSGIGASVTARATVGGRAHTQVRELGTQTSWRSQSGLWLHFGLGDAALVEELVVRWPSGLEQRIRDLPLNQGVTITEGEGWRPGLGK